MHTTGTLIMEYLKEITVWATPVQNHTYILSSAGHLIGYIKQGTTEEIIFKKPMKNFSKSRRKFVKVTPGAV